VRKAVCPAGSSQDLAASPTDIANRISAWENLRIPFHPEVRTWLLNAASIARERSLAGLPPSKSVKCSSNWLAGCTRRNHGCGW
jgi:hypothetical protein